MLCQVIGFYSTLHKEEPAPVTRVSNDAAKCLDTKSRLGGFCFLLQLQFFITT